jgi:membrane-associated protease RseP (regulator of RpoE activity)
LDSVREQDGRVMPPEFVWRPRPKFQDRTRRNALLFALTIVTTAFAGAEYYGEFLTHLGQIPLTATPGQLLAKGLWYSAAVLGILGTHELGHYLTCRYYDLDASLPFFIPLPVFGLTGTMGAFIRIREPFPNKRTLFDVGIAGPIAGFVVLVPLLFAGVAMSNIVPELNPEAGGYILFGEPLLMKLAFWLVWGTQQAGYTINLHPIGFAAWFGMLATALNLLPIGQLDGGHVTYAILGRRSVFVTLVGVAVTAGLIYFALTWIVWTLLMLVMLFTAGPHHPPVLDEGEPLDRARIGLAVLAAVIFVLCFTPAPIQIVDLIRH